ncbi:MAG: tRNA (adenosine(37)-N6)-threonylcarbamoyltransferase complex ATPase subunit type 1 TsaE [Candidatus Omnitrophica bacterium]|nr:tRNA (adenosine(37)-N6)-threonylcarbamoyltransferase complex ATPase subunit type 1 TsaE [Candidatus Omnitrophota bacterium]
MDFITTSEKETKRLAWRFAGYLKEGDLVLLEGPLGAGKTVFAKGILKRFGVNPDKVKSPTFTVIKEYKSGSEFIYHIDLYRLRTKTELLNLGYEDYFYSSQALVLIEWADKVESMIQKGIKVKMDYVAINKRKIKIEFKNHPEFNFSL